MYTFKKHLCACLAKSRQSCLTLCVALWTAARRLLLRLLRWQASSLTRFGAAASCHMWIHCASCLSVTLSFRGDTPANLVFSVLPTTPSFLPPHSRSHCLSCKPRIPGRTRGLGSDIRLRHHLRSSSPALWPPSRVSSPTGSRGQRAHMPAW